MSLQNYKDLCPFSRFIQRINRDHGLHYYSINTDLGSIGPSERETVKELLFLLDRNYNDVGFGDETIRDACCNYLNYWLDKQKEIYVSPNSGIGDDTWQTIENYWKSLRDPSTYICDRKSYDKSWSEKEKYIDFMVYCVNRECLKNLCLEANESYGNKKKYCNIFNEFTNKYHNEFIRKFPCLDDTKNDNIYTFNFSDNCTLQNMAKTFPEYDITADTIVNGKSRKTIDKCKNATLIGDDDASLANDPASLFDAQDILSDGQAPPVGAEAASAVGENGFQDSLSDSIQLAPQSQNELTSTENGTSKSMYYAGLSVSGVFFTSMVLYKYTALGPLIRSFVSKNEKLRQTTNKHLAQQWLERTSEYMDPNSENSHYNFPYQSMQN